MTRNQWIHRYIPRATAELLFFTCAVITLVVSLTFSLRLVRLHRKTSNQLYRVQPVLTIRYASVQDIELIRTLSLQIWPLTYASILTPAQIRYMMKLMYSEEALRNQMAGGHQFIIVYNVGVPIGFASYSEVEPSVYKLHKIYLLHKQQGRGSGRFVLEQILRDIQPKGATALRLNVNRNNTARLFYEKLGFRILREEDIDIGGGFFMNDYIMEKRI
jgi:ribosomal protein S18 acetylase RimI-like enzyme